MQDADSKALLFVQGTAAHTSALLGSGFWPCNLTMQACGNLETNWQGIKLLGYNSTGRRCRLSTGS